MNKRKKVVGIVFSILIFIMAWLAFCGYQWSWGPFEELHDYKTASLAGNAERYALDMVESKENSSLKDKNIVFLGSSVTYGASSMGVSFADYIGATNDCNIIKEAVSGTTLVDEGIDSYISRLIKIDAQNADIFVCQLSTNDATQKKPLGEISNSVNINDFDTKTVAGAIEYIIAYAKDKWDCPVVFYTNPKYDSENYQAMVNLLLEIQKKWNIEIIDMWNDVDFNNITDEQKSFYMADSIHPTQAGYFEWWTPIFEEKLIEVIENESN